MSGLKHLLYTSVAKKELEQHELEGLLAQSRANNAQADVTGLLLYRNGCFMQVLEGPESKVDTLYASISADTRHKNVFLLYESAISERDFAQWSMAFNGNESEKVEGLSDFLHPFRSQDEKRISEGAIKQLLKRFRQINKR
ncbi:BLUF domain-containing protein [Aliiglaciecola litoralis]|uniref:BLUF domain-containing protein n=1 Tax=Aliiglaciecola litoralis TaxID=582857 RepID=A0ABP3X3B0_9ALTE